MTAAPVPVPAPEGAGAVEVPVASPVVPWPVRLLVVHDDLALRLRLADLLAPMCPGAAIDTSGQRGAAELGPRLRDYAAAVVVVEFATRQPGGREPLAVLHELRAQARGLALVVLGAGGDERAAVRALRSGASDYWPLHSVRPGELADALREAVRALPAAPLASGATTRTHALPVVPGYRVLKEIARSARASLHVAESDELGHPVALKVHRHETATEASREERERFLRECRLLSQLNHRGVADVYDFGVEDDCHWLALEYFPCGSLKARLQHPLTEAEALAYVGQLATALRAVHAAGIVHRDLKPSNVMLRADDTLALIDFGLARPALAPTSVTSPHVRVGSPYYMAPEQIDGLPPDARCDLYSLGVLFHELLTGRPPFAGRTVAEVLEQHRRARAPRLPEALARWQPVVDRLLGKRPPDRYASADELLAALVPHSPDAARSTDR